MSNEKIEETKIEYILKGDYYVPNLYLPEENYLYYISPDEDFSNDLKIDIYRKKILKNVNKQKRKYIKKQMDYMYENIMNYSDYVTEKYYRNGFCDAFELFLGLLQ